MKNNKKFQMWLIGLMGGVAFLAFLCCLLGMVYFLFSIPPLSPYALGCAIAGGGFIIVFFCLADYLQGIK